MYAPGTILAPHDGADRPRLRVIGPSPIQAPTDGEWGSAGGEAMVVTNADVFDTNVVIPVTHLNVFWYVESEPEQVPDTAVIERPRPLSEQMTPEQQFQAAARERAAEAAEAEALAAIAEGQAEAIAESATIPEDEITADPNTVQAVKRGPGRPRKAKS